MYLAKLNKVLNFMNKPKQIYNLNKSSQYTQKYMQKLKNEFSNSLDQLRWNLYTKLIKSSKFSPPPAFY